MWRPGVKLKMRLPLNAVTNTDLRTCLLPNLLCYNTVAEHPANCQSSRELLTRTYKNNYKHFLFQKLERFRKKLWIEFYVLIGDVCGELLCYKDEETIKKINNFSCFLKVLANQPKTSFIPKHCMLCIRVDQI